MGGDILLNHALNLEAAGCKSRSLRGYTMTRDRELLGWTASVLAFWGESVISEECQQRRDEEADQDSGNEEKLI
jgi:hypothetical protein